MKRYAEEARIDFYVLRGWAAQLGKSSGKGVTSRRRKKGFVQLAVSGHAVPVSSAVSEIVLSSGVRLELR